MKNLSTCPHCGQQPTVSRMLDDVVIACLDHDMVAQAAGNDDAVAMWETIVEIRNNVKNLSSEETA